MIYADPTETRRGSRLPRGLVVKELPGLEKMTGADLYISDKVYGETSDNEFFKDGLLVQRKTGSDYLNSIPHLSEIQLRMTGLGSVVMLLVQGTLEQRGEHVLWDGQETGWSAFAIAGAMVAWQLSGGVTLHTINSAQTRDMLRSFDNNIHTMQQDRVVRPEVRKLRPGEHAKYPFIFTLETFPGLGTHKAAAICAGSGTLADALVTLANDELVTQVPGIGKRLALRFRRYLGLKDGGTLTIEGRVR